jgi:hypothetical protein
MAGGGEPAEPPDPGSRPEGESGGSAAPGGGPVWISMYAEASGDARVYMAGRDQYIYEAADQPRVVPPAGSRAAEVADQLLVGFQPPPVLEGLVARVRRHRWTSVTGSAGSGKTTLLTALARPQADLGLVPNGFVHALVFCDATSTAEALALELRDQLLVSLPGYEQALAAHYQADPAGFQGEDGIGRYVRGPLSRLSADAAVRLVVDGLDLLGPESAAEIPARLAELAADAALTELRLVVSHRDDDPPGTPASGARLAVDAVSFEVVTRYMQARRLETGPARQLAALCCRGGSAWLAARLLADIYGSLDAAGQRELVAAVADPAKRATGLALLWDRRLDRVPGWTRSVDPGDPDIEWARRLRPVLTALAAAGPGPVMPLPLLAAVSAEFGGPDRPDGVRAVLDGLGGLVLHTRAGTDQELIGLFHLGLVEHLAAGVGRRLDVAGGRRVLLQAIDRLAPVTAIYTDNPLYRWATGAEAEHYWQSGMPISAYMSLFRRPLPAPRQDLDRWTSWLTRFHAALGPTDRYTLGARANIATLTGRTGDAAGALRLFQQLVPDQERVLGPHHPDTLTTRHNIAHWTGETGDPAGALRLARQVAPDQERVLGPHHPDTLGTRHNIAHWTGQTGDPAGALRLARQLLPDEERVLGPQHPTTLTTRHNIAHLTGQTGDPARALRLAQQLLPDRERVLGPHHPDTLTTRSNIVHWTGKTGDPAEALRLAQQLLPDRERVLGPHHPDTLSTRHDIAHWEKQRRVDHDPDGST